MDVSKLQLTTLIDHLPGMVYRCLGDAAWTVIYVSDGAQSLTGYTPADWLDDRTVSFSRIIPPEDWDRIHKEAQSSQQGEPVQLMYRITTADGQEKWVLDHRSGVHRDGTQWYHEGFITDATRNARLMQELEEYSQDLEQIIEDRVKELRRTKDHVEAILTRSPDAILFLTPEFRINSANPAFHSLFNYDVDELVGEPLMKLVTPEQKVILWDALVRCRNGEADQRLDLMAYRKDETTFDADFAFAPIREQGELTGIVCSVRDISSLKEIERLKDQFVSNVSHELRTPITSMRLNFDLIERDGDNTAKYIQRIGREVSRLDTLIEDLLRLSRLDQGKVEINLAPMDVNLLAAHYAEDRQPLAKAKDLSLTLDGAPALPAVVGDVGLLGQALSVLLTNAITYTPSGGSVLIRTQTALRNGLQWVGITVSDTGQGISPEEVPHLFDRFYRGKVGRKSQAPGTGLGLAIAWQIARRLQGEIEVDPGGQPNIGASFTIWLPAR